MHYCRCLTAHDSNCFEKYASCVLIFGMRVCGKPRSRFHVCTQDLTSKIRKLKDFRQQLIMTNNEMNQELQEVMEQRIGLEIQFEHLMHRNDFL